MSKERRSIESARPQLELDEQLEMHKVGWVAQTIGLIFIFSLVAAAAAGLFGDGPVSKRIETSPGATLEYQRFSRYQAETELNLSLIETSGDVIISLPNDYLNNIEVRSIQPEPESSEVDDGYVRYHFKMNGNSKITFFITPQQFGNLDGGIDVNDQRFLFKQFIYP